MNILLLTTGSVSARLEIKLADILTKDGHSVKQYRTAHAEQIMDQDPKCQGKSCDSICKTIMAEAKDWALDGNGNVAHIRLVEWADLCIVCPADYNILGKAANGIANDFVSTIISAYLGSGKTLWMAEAMNPMMYLNKIRERNRGILDSLGVMFIEPTVKKLACGDYGIGGLADIGAIKNIAVDGHRWKMPIHPKKLMNSIERHYLRHMQQNFFGNPGPYIEEVKSGFSFANYLPLPTEQGAFGAKRKYDRHEGVDIYCKYGAEVHAVEDGEVVDSYQYTGAAADCKWWNDTWCIKIKGKSGVVTYGELQMPDECPEVIDFSVELKNRDDAKKAKVKFRYPPVGTKIKTGDLIGFVGKVLPDEKRRDDIRNHNNCMLHMELRTESCHLDGWKLDGDRDKRLLDPTPYLVTATMPTKDDTWDNEYFTSAPKYMKEGK